MDKSTLADKAAELATGLEKLAQQAGDLANSATQVVVAHGDVAAAQGVTNAISSVIIVGGLLAVGPALLDFSKVMGFFAVLLASINIFGGFIVTQRMLAMFKKKQK
jgi:H+-translocating NAD(P) transhydrogenase subunit alpha